jgi:hypothetical protein
MTINQLASYSIDIITYATSIPQDAVLKLYLPQDYSSWLLKSNSPYFGYD